MPATCPACGCPTADLPTSPTGHCAACAQEACAWGDGGAVGLPPVPSESVHDWAAAMARHAAHADGTDPEACPVCALATPVCSECGEHIGQMSAEAFDAHVIAMGMVLVGCELYQYPALRMLAVHDAEATQR